jgi:putative salt-induced outer membrane protein YdiY
VNKLILLFSLTSITIAQVNTEAIRNSSIKNGFRSKIDLLFGLNAGNSEYISGEANLRMDYIGVNYRTFIAGQIAYKEGNEEVISNKGFLHGRFIYELSELFEPELFLQKEYNEFVLIADRNLAGGGIRWSIFDNDFVADSSREFDLFLGVGAMYEMEEINQNPTAVTEILRSTNYLTLLWKPSENFLLNSVTYFQVDVNRLADHRVLNDTNLNFKITESVKFVFSLSYRYDSEPPGSIKPYDLELKNGITFEL